MPYRVKAYRGPGSFMGASERWAIGPDRQPVEFSTMAEARDQAETWNRQARSGNVSYVAQEVE